MDAQNRFMGKSFEIRPTGTAHAELISPEEQKAADTSSCAFQIWSVGSFMWEMRKIESMPMSSSEEVGLLKKRQRL